MNDVEKQQLKEQYAGRAFTYVSDLQSLFGNGEWSASLYALAEDLELYEVYHNRQFLDCDEFITCLANMNVGETIDILVRIVVVSDDYMEVPTALEQAKIQRIS